MSRASCLQETLLPKSANLKVEKVMSSSFDDIRGDQSDKLTSEPRAFHPCKTIQVSRPVASVLRLGSWSSLALP